MRTIKIDDKRDYDPSWTLNKRDSVRGIIFVGEKLLMVRSEKYGDYHTPGGGINPGETHRDALVREVLEETGFRVLEDTIRPYGWYMRRLKGMFPQEIFEQENFYYTCDVDFSESTALKLDEGYEQEYGYRPVLATFEEAIAANAGLAGNPAVPWVERELFVLEELCAAR